MPAYRNHPPDFQDGVAERLAAAGRAPAAVAALLDLDQGLFLWNRAVARGEGISDIVASLGLDLEQAEFGALTAVSRIVHGVGREIPEEATVGALAAELRIDPSRASRLAAQLVARGLVRREAAQPDARKTVLRLTDAALAMLARFRDRKWDRHIRVFADWTDAEIESFAQLMRRFMEGVRASRGQD